ncbi:MAG TPA: hypothetical protein VMX17_01540 [Candidatus Glassbacteria bacterium]|nr:hypothetical protein [Candidatus Glassbacteria bacterium]
MEKEKNISSEDVMKTIKELADKVSSLEQENLKLKESNYLKDLYQKDLDRLKKTKSIDIAIYVSEIDNQDKTIYGISCCKFSSSGNVVNFGDICVSELSIESALDGIYSALNHLNMNTYFPEKNINLILNVQDIKNLLLVKEETNELYKEPQISRKINGVVAAIELFQLSERTISFYEDFLGETFCMTKLMKEQQCLQVMD